MKHYIAELQNSLDTLPKRTSKQNPEAYIGGGQSKLKYIGLRVPDLKMIMLNGFSFSKLEPKEIAKIWDYVWWNSDCYEVISFPLAWFYDPKQRKLLASQWSTLKKWSSKIDNWAHSDTLSGIYARILEDNPGQIYPTLVKWNGSKNPWLRRLSMVSLLFYSSQREKILPVSKILPLVYSQLSFKDYYVQKGVGWTLRECHNVYPEKTYSFIRKNIFEISATAFSSATEKMPQYQKDSLKKLRRLKRQNG